MSDVSNPYHAGEISVRATLHGEILDAAACLADLERETQAVLASLGRLGADLERARGIGAPPDHHRRMRQLRRRIEDLVEGARAAHSMLGPPAEEP